VHPPARQCTRGSLRFRRRADLAGAGGALDQPQCASNPQRGPKRAGEERAKRDHPPQDLLLATALRLPTFRAAGVDRLKRLTLVVERRTRTIVRALYPVTDPVGAISDALAVVADAAISPPRAGRSG